MAETHTMTSLLGELRSPEQQNLLDEIDSLRRQGISEFVFLPQIVVCGDQSSGKSSVLEAISGVPFPRNDILCTRFATEVVLRDSPSPSATVTITPEADTPEHQRAKFEAFKRTLSSIDDLPSVVDEAKEVMGISTATGGRTFSKCILRVEISGPKQPKLTVVDLPGLIHTGSKAQSTADVDLISDLVQSYISNPRSIILAVVSARNDIANQIVLTKARSVDPKGIRTLGLITKPDTLPRDSDSEAEFFDLASNNNIHFRLGWHVVKNRNYEMRGCSTEERDASERDFLSQGVWADLLPGMRGIAALRQRLSRILFLQIKRSLPSLIEDVKRAVEDTEAKLEKMGSRRTSVEEQRAFLLRLSQSFQELCKDAAEGKYEDAFFGYPENAEERIKRLRANVQNENITFARDMAEYGHKRIITEKSSSPQISGQVVMTRSEALKWVQKLLTYSRGRELPGSFNPLLVGDLFRDQSSPWEAIARVHIDAVWDSARKFMRVLIKSLTDSETFSSLFAHCITPAMMKRLEKATQSLTRLLTDRARHPITYNHYYIETLQNMKKARRNEEMKRTIRNFIRPQYGAERDASDVLYELDSLVNKLDNEPDMNANACSDLLDSMQAYYKVALKTFIDNVVIQVVEAELIGDIWTIFTPSDVGKMTPEMLSKIAGESPEAQARREQLERKLEILRRGLETCLGHCDGAGSGA